MIKTLAAAAALFCILPGAGAAMAQSADHDARLAAAHALMDPKMDEMMRPRLLGFVDGLASEGYGADEVAALRAAMNAEADVLIGRIQDVTAEAVARHVALEDIHEDADLTAPSWEAAGTEMEGAVVGWDQAWGIDLAVRVFEKGCVVRPTPSEACVAALGRAADYRAGRVTVEEIMAD